jgi:hypothetical protein
MNRIYVRKAEVYEACAKSKAQLSKANVWSVSLETKTGVQSRRLVMGFLQACSMASTMKREYPDAEVRLPAGCSATVMA